MSKQLFDVTSWSVDDVADWLSNDLNLPRHAPKFRKFHVNGIMLEKGLSDTFLENQLNVTIRLHRLKIQRSAEQLCGKLDRTSSSSPPRRQKIPRSVTSAPSKLRPNFDRQKLQLQQQQKRQQQKKKTNRSKVEVKSTNTDEGRWGKNAKADDTIYISPRINQASIQMNDRPRAQRSQKKKKNRPGTLLNNGALKELERLEESDNKFGSSNSGRRLSVKSPVSSLRAKNLSGRRSGRVLGRSSPRPNSPSVRSSISSEEVVSPLPSHLTKFHATDGSSTTATGSSGDDKNFSRELTLVQKQKQKQKLKQKLKQDLSSSSKESSKESDDCSWRPFSAPIGYAKKKYKRERRNSTDSMTSTDSRPSSGGRSSKGSSTTMAKYRRDTPWTWDQLWESSHMLILPWLEKVAASTLISNSWEDELGTVVRSMKEEGYVTVRDLLSDVNELDFRSDLRSWGMRKRFLNEVIHRLKDMEDAFDVLTERQNSPNERNDRTIQFDSRSSSSSSSSSSSNVPSAPKVEEYLWQQRHYQNNIQRQQEQKKQQQQQQQQNQQQEQPFHVVGPNKRHGLLHRPANLSIITKDKIIKRDSVPLPIPYQTTSPPKTINQVAATESERMAQRRPSALQLEEGKTEENDNAAWGGLANSQSFIITPKGSIVTGPFRIGPSGTVPTTENDENNIKESFDIDDCEKEEDEDDIGNQSLHKKRLSKKSPGKPRRSNSVISSPSGGSIEDDLVILRRLGSGAGGVVHKALHVPSLTVVAVKKIRVFSKSEMKQLKKELVALYKCSAVPTTSSNRKEHPGIMRARGAGGTRSSASGVGGGSLLTNKTNIKSSGGGNLSPLGQGECPHVVSFYDAFSTSSGDHTISLVLEYMDAGSLQDLINTSKFLFFLFFLKKCFTHLNVLFLPRIFAF
jgi:hypothetical protein